MTVSRDMIRPVVRGAYDQQKLRIMMGNRIVANFKAKLGQKPSESEDESLDADAMDMLDRLRDEYKLLGTSVAQFRKTKGEPQPFKGGELIATETELVLVEQYLDLEDAERRCFRRLEKVLERIPIYTQWLSKQKGIGPAMAAVIISEIDITKSRYVSSIWRYAGLDVADNGAGRSRKAEHLIDREYTDRDGNAAVRKSITFNPWLKTKLVGVLGPSFIKCGNEKYRKIYDDYKHRLESHEKYKDVSKGHRHAMAVRYMVKIFLQDLYAFWRQQEGLEVALPYDEAKLGHKHGGHAA